MNPASAEKSAPGVHLDSSWSTFIQASAREVFLMVAGTEIQFGDSALKPQPGEVSATVRLAGAIRGTFCVHCSWCVAANIAAKMLGGPGDSSQICDALGEICNMVAGNFKDKIASLSDHCMLSVPSVVAGSDSDAYSSSQDRVEVSLRYSGSPVWITLEIRS